MGTFIGFYVDCQPMLMLRWTFWTSPRLSNFS